MAPSGPTQSSSQFLKCWSSAAIQNNLPCEYDKVDLWTFISTGWEWDGNQRWDGFFFHQCRLHINAFPPFSPLCSRPKTISGVKYTTFHVTSRRVQRGEITISHGRLSAHTEKWRQSCNLLITHNSRRAAQKQACLKCAQSRKHNQEKPLNQTWNF